MTDPFAEARDQAEARYMLRAIAAESLDLDPHVENVFERLAADLRLRVTARDALYVARHVRCVEDDEQGVFYLADQDVWRALIELLPQITAKQEAQQ